MISKELMRLEQTLLMLEEVDGTHYILEQMEQMGCFYKKIQITSVSERVVLVINLMFQVTHGLQVMYLYKAVELL